MEFKGTKKLNILESNEIGFGIGTDRNNIKLSVWGNDEESKANALLISKAPEMLQMLTNIKDQLNSEDKWSVEQLIKQATEL